MDSNEAKSKNIVDMAFTFSAMTRVFAKGSTERIVAELDDALSKIASLQNVGDYENLHDDGLCRWFMANIRTAKHSHPA